MSALPTLIFVPGAWHKPTCYTKIIDRLQDRRFRSRCVTLPSTSGDPDATFKDDVDAARAAIAAETTAGNDVVVIAHSYGGGVGSSAIKGYTQPRHDVDGLATGAVMGLILIASGYNLAGLSFMDPFFGHPPPSWRVNKDTGYAELVAAPRDFFYHDLPDDEAQYWVSQLTNQSLKALFEGGEHSCAGWQEVPSWYIGTTEDRGLPVAAQRMSVAMAREMGARVEHREIRSSHSPFLSQPWETANIITLAVEAFQGTHQEETQVTQMKNVGKLPRVQLLRPLTWVAYGIPLIFGRLLGRGFMIYYWIRRRRRP